MVYKTMRSSAKPRFSIAVPVLLLLSASVCRGQLEYPTFSLLFEPCPASVEVAPNRDLLLPLDVVMVTSDNPDAEEGAQGWSVSMIAEGVEIVDITTAGTLAAAIDDSPPGLRDTGFERSELGALYNDFQEEILALGAISAVVLSFIERITLPPEGPALIAKISVSGQTPGSLGERLPARVAFVDDVKGAG